MRTQQTQLRIEASVKNQFQQACRQSGSNMTTEIYRFMRHFIKQLDVLDIQRRTGMVQDHRGTWMSRDIRS